MHGKTVLLTRGLVCGVYKRLLYNVGVFGELGAEWSQERFQELVRSQRLVDQFFRIQTAVFHYPVNIIVTGAL